MKDHDIEQLLKRYAPAGPSPELRARIVQPGRPGRIWPWAIAASVLLVATVALQIGTDRIAAGIIAPGPDPSRLAVDDLADMLGGDEVARRYAEAAFARSRDQAARAPGAAAFANEGDDIR